MTVLGANRILQRDTISINKFSLISNCDVRNNDIISSRHSCDFDENVDLSEILIQVNDGAF